MHQVGGAVDSMSIEIRAETPADSQIIEAVTASAFWNAPHTSRTEQHIVNALRKAGELAISLVAEEAGGVIGHVAMSPVSISDDATGWFGLGPISVLPQHQRRGVGSQLVREALRLLRAGGASGCVVLGEPEYYRRFGFQPDPNLVLAGVLPEYFQVISFALSKPSGIVTYHQAFNVQAKPDLKN
jgi:putative acetyltransferase